MKTSNARFLVLLSSCLGVFLWAAAPRGFGEDQGVAQNASGDPSLEQAVADAYRRGYEDGVAAEKARQQNNNDEEDQQGGCCGGGMGI